MNNAISIYNKLYDMDYNDYNETREKDLLFIQEKINNGLLDLFNAMKKQIGVMAEHNDDETSLLYELVSADDDIFIEYKETYL